MQNNVIPGAVGLIASPDRDDWTGTFGTGTLGAEDPMSVDDHFRNAGLLFPVRVRTGTHQGRTGLDAGAACRENPPVLPSMIYGRSTPDDPTRSDPRICHWLLWVLPGISALAALLDGFVVSHNDVVPGSAVVLLAFQGTADGACTLLSSITDTVVTVIALVLGLTADILAVRPAGKISRPSQVQGDVQITARSTKSEATTSQACVATRSRV